MKNSSNTTNKAAGAEETGNTVLPLSSTLGENLLRNREGIDLKYIVIDTETESLNQGCARPWQVAILVVHGKTVVEEHNMTPMIDDLRVSKDAARITSFDFKAYLDRAKPAIETLKVVDRFLRDDSYLIVGQNYICYDYFIIRNLYRYCGVDFPCEHIRRVYDTKSLGRAIQLGEEIPSRPDEIPLFMLRFALVKRKNIKADNKSLAKLFDVPYALDKAHDALYDCHLTQQIFRAMYLRNDIY